MSTSRWHYVRELSEQLRINGVPESEVRDIVAQVEGHIGATGEDPVSAFGQPVDYARQWRTLSRWRWAGQVLLGAAVAVGVACGIAAIFADQQWGEDVPITGSDLFHSVFVFCLVGLMPWTAGLVESRRRASRLGESATPSPWPIRIATVSVLGVLLGVLSWVLDGTAGSTILAQLPRWSLAVLAVTGIAVGLCMGPSPNSASQAPAPPWAPRHSWKTRVRRAFINR